MRLKSMLLISLPILFWQFGCASKGFNRGELKEQIGVSKPSFDDNEIKAAYNKKANLPRPFKLGVYFKSPSPAQGAQKQWRWTEQDKKLLEEIGKELLADGLVADVFPIASSLVQNEELKSLRLVAAKHQADALLIVSGAGEIDRYTNNLGWSYIFLVPTLFVQGSQADTLFVTNASLWDVKSEFLYLTAESEGMSSDRYAAAFGKNDKELLDDAKTKSLTSLKSELKKMVKGAKL